MAEETKDEVVEPEAPCLLMPVVNNKDLASNLEACTKDPNNLEPEAFGQLEHEYSKALNTSDCPCESGKMFTDCCKPMWRLAKSAWDAREDEAKKLRREAHKAELDANAQDKKDVAKAKEICRIMIMPNGQLAVQIANDRLPLVQVASVLMECHDKVVLQQAAQQTMQMLQAISQQAISQQAQPGGNAPLEI